MKIHRILYFSDTLKISMLELDMFDGQTSGVGYVSEYLTDRPMRGRI